MPAAKKKSPAKKDKTYIQKGKRSASLIIRTSHTSRNPLQWVDSNGNPRSLRYCTNQESVFMDEQKGEVILGRVIMINGVLNIPKENQPLQKFLDITPDNGKLFEEFDPEKKAQEEFDQEEQEFKAKKFIFDSTTNDLSSLGLAIYGNRSKKLTTSELKRDLLVEAKKDPQTIIDLAEDSDLHLLALASDAFSAGLLTKKNDKVYIGEDLLLEVPYGEDAEEVVKRYMKTSDGAKVEKFLKSKLK